MQKVFISGSRSIRTMPAEAVTSLTKIVAQGFYVLIGDCYGVDAMVQTWLASQNYPNVIVYHIGEKPRTNIGRWTTERVPGFRQPLKDEAMSTYATLGLAIWDGRSPGTKNNVDRMRAAGKFVRLVTP